MESFLEELQGLLKQKHFQYLFEGNALRRQRFAKGILWEDIEILEVIGFVWEALMWYFEVKDIFMC